MPSDITGTNVLEEDEHGKRQVPLRRRADLHQHPAGRRNQPHAAQDAGRAAAGDAGARSDRRPDRPTTLPDPFFVIATQNPIEQEGTYPLPEAQLDRFMFNIKVDYPTSAEEEQILAPTTRDEKPEVRKVLSAQGDRELAEAGRHGGGERVHHQVRRRGWCGRRGPRTRRPRSSSRSWSTGAPARAGQFLIHGGKAMAAMDGRFSVAIDDVQQDRRSPCCGTASAPTSRPRPKAMTNEDVIERSDARELPHAGDSEVRGIVSRCQPLKNI